MPFTSGEQQNLSDDELISLAKSGDQKAVEELFDRYYKRIYVFLYRATGRREDAEDLCQEAFLLAFKNIGSFKGKSSFFTWVYKIAINRFRDHVRREKRRPLPIKSQVDEESFTGSVDTRASLVPQMSDEPGDKVETYQDVRKALQRIHPKYRVPLLLNAVEEMPYEEIARLLGLPVGTVKSRIFRARMMLAEMMGEKRATEKQRGTN